MIQIRRR